VISSKWQEIDFSRTESFLKISGKYQELYSYSLFSEIVLSHAESLGLDLTDEALQAYSNQARRALGLHKKEDFDKFLSKAEADYDTWERVCANELCRMILRNNLGGSVEYIPDAWPIIKSVPGIKEAVNDLIIAKGSNAGITLSDQDIQVYSDNLRRVSGLHRKSEFDEYLKIVNMDYDGWEKSVKAEMFRNELLKKNIQPLTSEDLALNQQISGSMSMVIAELIHSHFIKTQSGKLGITVNDEELQNYLTDFRRANNLHSAKMFHSWLSANGMTLEDFEIVADLKIRTAKFRESGKAQIEPEKVRKEVRLSISFIDAALRIASEKEAFGKNSIPAPSEDDLQEESDALRRALKLHSSELFKSYLKNNGITADNWEDYLEHTFMVRKLKDKVAGDSEIIKYLNVNMVLRKAIREEILSNYLSGLSV